MMCPAPAHFTLKIHYTFLPSSHVQLLSVFYALFPTMKFKLTDSYFVTVDKQQVKNIFPDQLRVLHQKLSFECCDC